MKRCRRCGEVKPRSEFYEKWAECKHCATEVQRERRAADPEKNRRIQRESYLRHKEERDAAKAAYLEANADREAARQARYREENREAIRRRNREWRRANYRKNREKYLAEDRRYKAARRQRLKDDPEFRKKERVKARERAARRRALERATKIRDFTGDELEQRMYATYAGKCWICRSARWSTIDHVKPLSSGGPHILANLRPACAFCNASKQARWPFDRSQVLWEVAA